MSIPALKILYFGSDSGTCLDRANAYRRLGHYVEHINLRKLLPKISIVDILTWRVGGHLFTPLLISKLKPIISNKTFDICHVDGGEWITPKLIEFIKQTTRLIVNYNHDDPFSPRDRKRFKAYRDSVPYYDLLVVVRVENVAEAKQLNVKKVLRIYRCADEVSHAPKELSAEDREKWASEVLFLGTWMPERGGFLLKLIELGIPLSIRGANWHKAPEWPQLKPYFKGGELRGEEYTKAIQCAKVSIGLLSKGNRDLHTTRSAEIPAIGGLLCAERTSEHLYMFIEGQEALFWESPEECAKMCQYALDNEERRSNIAQAGHEKLKSQGFLNEVMLNNILENAFQSNNSNL